jgi:ABC-type branched-subunit amino acid transport system substrate-binding protein
MLPLRSRSLGGAEPLTLHARSVIFGMALTIGAAGIGYLAHPSPKQQVLQVGSLAPGQAGIGSDGGVVPGSGGQALSSVSGGAGSGSTLAGSSKMAGAGSSGAGSAASGGAGGGAGGGTTAAAAEKSGQLSYGPLRATDQGVTKDGIKLGFLIANTNQLSAAGFNAGLAGDQTKIITAWTNEINRTGGVLGRKLSAYSQTFNVLDANDMQAACKTMTQDQKVFSVIPTGGYDSVAQLCIAKENKTPFISTDPEPASWYKQAAPYMWATFMNKDRLALNQAKWLATYKYLHPNDKVGVIYHDIPNVAPSVEGSLLPALNANGIHPVDVVKLVIDRNLALAQVSYAVHDMRQKGVTFVIFEMNLIYKSKFMQEADKEQWHPRYTDSDEYFGCGDFVTSAYPPSQFDGTQCLGTTLSGLKNADQLTNAFTKYCDEVYKRTYPQGYATEGSNKSNQDTQRLLNYQMGSEILLWKQAAERAGTQLTRALWGKAMGMTGRYAQQVVFCSMTFGPNKWDGSDELSVAQWHAEASDGFAADKFHQNPPGCFKNYY